MASNRFLEKGHFKKKSDFDYYYYISIYFNPLIESTKVDKRVASEMF